MKKSLIIAAFSFLVLPGVAFAQTVPAFPMAFWGVATINGTVAPTGTIVRAYYGSVEAASSTVQSDGAYGFSASTKQKLVLGSGTGTISFTVQSVAFNGGAETAGTSAQSHSAFTAGTTVEKNLAFTISIPTPPSTGGGGGGGGSSGGSSSGSGSTGGGGGGGGGGYIPPVVTPPAPVVVATTTAPAPKPVTPGRVLGASIYHFTRDLRQGHRGDDVSALQRILIQGGHMTGEATGYFGPVTTAAVKKFQKAKGISAVGHVGPQTRTALEASGQTEPENTRPVSDSSSAPATTATSKFVFTRNLAVGSRGTDVSELQKRLQAEGLFDGDITTYFGNVTRAAVIAFQKKNGLEAVGIVGPKTRVVLNQ